MENSIELKVGNVVQLYRLIDGTIHNMIILMDCNNNAIAMEELLRDDKPTFSGITGGNYTYLDMDAYPKTLGIETTFGNVVVEVYKGIGSCTDNIVKTFNDINRLNEMHDALFLPFDEEHRSTHFDTLDAVMAILKSTPKIRLIATRLNPNKFSLSNVLNRGYSTEELYGEIVDYATANGMWEKVRKIILDVCKIQ